MAFQSNNRHCKRWWQWTDVHPHTVTSELYGLTSEDHQLVQLKYKYNWKCCEVLTGPLMVPEAIRSPGLRLHPVIEWWTSCCFAVQYRCYSTSHPHAVLITSSTDATVHHTCMLYSSRPVQMLQVHHTCMLYSSRPVQMLQVHHTCMLYSSVLHPVNTLNQFS